MSAREEGAPPATSRPRSADVIDSALVCGFFGCLRLRGLLQNRGVLSFAKESQQDHPAVGKF
jgi:hypothetical protein